MRTNLVIFISLLMALLLSPLASQGQTCTPDPNAPASGLTPDSLAPACPGDPYNFVITLGVPADTVVPAFGTVTIDSIVINNITDLPPGITYACNPGSCSFPGGTKGCLVFSGTPTASGTFLLDLNVTIYTPILNLPAVLTDTLAFEVGFSGSAVTTDASCGGSDGTATVGSLTGTPPYSFVWDDPNTQTDSIAVNLAAGSYNADVTDASGCTVTFTVSVNSGGGAAPVIDPAQSTVGWSGCASVDGGFVLPDVSGGAAPLTFSWSNGATSEDLIDVPDGTYTLTVGDANGCSSSETFTVSAPDSLAISVLNTADASCAGEADGAGTVGVQGGESPYTFAWSPSGQTVAAVTGLAAGIYNVTVEDAVGCEQSIAVEIDEPDPLGVITNVTDETAAGANDGTITAGASGGTPPYTFDWGGAGTGTNLTGLAPGEYIVTVTDDNGCETRDTVTVASATSIQLPAGVEAMQVYPNPSRGQVSLDLTLVQPTAVTVKVYDLQGRMIKTQSATAADTHQLRLDLAQAPQGTYLLEVQAGQVRLHRRLLLN